VAGRVAGGGDPLELAGGEVELRPAEGAQAPRTPVEARGDRLGRRTGDAVAQPRRARQVAVEVVAGEQLVAAQPGEGDGDVLPDVAVQQVQLQRVDLRLLGVADRVGQVSQGGLVQHQLVVVGLVVLGDEAGVGQLVGRLAEPQAEGLDRPAVAAAHHRHDRARVDPARQRDAEGHVGEELADHRCLVVLADAVDPVVAAQRVVGRPVDARVRERAHRPVAQLQRVTGGQSVDPPEERVVAGHVPDVHRQVEAGFVELGVDQAAAQHRLGLRTERQPATALGVDHRLDAERVAHEVQRAAAPVEQGEGEDAVQARCEPDALLVVQVRQHLGVAGGLQRVPLGEHVGAQLGVVVDLAVVDHDHRAVGVGHRLGAAGDVEDRQAAVAEAHPVTDEEAVAVRPAVHDRVGHRPQQCRVAEAGRSGDAAHQRPPLAAKFDSK
jgi:hypothetical protein